MRIAYVTIHIAPEIMQGGVGRKIKTHIKLWREKGHEVSLFSLTPAEIPLPGERQFIFSQKGGLLKREVSRAKVLKQMLVEIGKYKPDIIYLRYGLYSYPLHRIFRIAPVVLDTNANDRREYASRGQFFYWMNRLTRGLTIGPADGVVTPSHELAEILVPGHDKPVCVVANGVDLKDVDILPAPKNEHPVITMVGSPGMRWHGVDKLLEFAGLYPDIKVNVIGTSPEDIDTPVPSNVVFHGYLAGSKVREVLEKTDVACGTLAFHRSGINEASALKTREALAYGIPVIIAFRDTDLDGMEIETILQLPNTEDNMQQNAERVHTFAYDMMGKRVDFNQIAPYLDQRIKEEKRLAFFAQLISKSNRV